MKRLKATAAVLCALALAGCGWHGTGTVTDKSHRQAYVTTSIICGAYSTQGFCTVWIPQTTEWPETWGLKLHAADGDHWVDVSAATYDAVRDGDSYTVKGDS